MFARAAATSAMLSALFLVTYNFTNWLTSLRSDVGTCYFDWELAIPFVPLMIVPYMSVDLFFLGAPFLCKERRELSVLAWRIGLAIIAAGICFLIWPLNLGFERPHVEGILGAIFNPFLEVDRPFNLAPSLHITLRTILADFYARKTRGVLRWANHIWFSIIGVSTVLTHQHHLVDLVSGFALGVVCFYAVPAQPMRFPVLRNRRVGVYYAFGALLSLVLALVTWPWGMLMLWPAVALFITATAYWWVGPGIFRKQAGRLPISSRLLLGPIVLGQHLSHCYYRRECRAWDEVTPRVWFGRKLDDTEAARAVQLGVIAVLDLTVESAEAAPFRNVRYQHLPVLDLTAPTLDHLRDAAQFIAEHSAAGVVYVHCKIGYSRSAAAVGAYLLSSGQARNTDDVLAILRRVRPTIIVRPEAIEALRDFEKRRS
ncbi:MAG: phosphatase PAP2/dual specificity phosphatase family protein [Planctomycetota bacterium]